MSRLTSYFVIAFVLGPLVARATPAPRTASPPSIAAENGQKDGLEHGRLAANWFEAHGRSPAAPEDVDLHELVREEFVHVRLGAFQIYLPDSALRDTGTVGDLQKVFQALIESQGLWISWLPADVGTAGDRKAVASDVQVVSRWISKWKPKDLARLAPLAGKDLFRALEPKDKVRGGVAALASAMAPGGPFGSKDEDAKPPTIVLLPTRAQFIELACVVGWVLTDYRDGYWADDLANWTELDFYSTRLIPMQYAAPEAQADYTKGISMNSRNPRALEQHVVQLATRALLDANFGEHMEPMLAGGMANSLVIDQFGEIDTRTDGDLRSKDVGGRSMFIPASMGGQSSGGSLPPGNADSRWRKERGKGHFVRELRASQKQGGKEAESKKERPLYFVLEAEDGTERVPVRAPFLGGEAPERKLSAKLSGDYLEFLRAYRAAFLYWLRTHAGGKSKASQESFGALLAQLSDPKIETDFPTALQEVFRVPLSSAQPGKDDLEGRFLAWLERQ